MRGPICALAVLATGMSGAACGEMVWFGLQKSNPFEHTAQRFMGCGSPDLVIGSNYDADGRYYNLAISDWILYSGNLYSVHRWDCFAGNYLGELALDEPLDAHLDAWLHGIGTGPNGDLLFSSFGYTTEQRTVARYSPDGSWRCDYTHPNLQHVQGTPAADTDAVFAASRYNPGPGWVERVLMFESDGAYVGEFGAECEEGIGDVAVMGEYIYLLDYAEGVRAYKLSGTSLPTHDHVIAFPPPVNPSDTLCDELYAHDDYLYVSDGADNAWYRMKPTGVLDCAYDGEIRGPDNFLGSLAVCDAGLPGGIALGGGWDLIGYERPDGHPTLLERCLVHNGVEMKTWDDAVAAGWVATFVYFYNTGAGYGTLCTSGCDDDSFRSGRGYWILTYVPNLTLVAPD